MRNPYNKLTLFFQGIVLVPRAQLIIGEDVVDQRGGVNFPNISCARVFRLDLSLQNLLRATFSGNYINKMGGPCPLPLKSQWPHSINDVFKALASGAGYPMIDNKTKNKAPYSSPADWWRWALIFMKPADLYLQQVWPNVPHLGTMTQILGKWQLFRHIKTRFKVMATDDLGHQTFSPVASLFVQDRYWGYRAFGDHGGSIWYKQGTAPMFQGHQTTHVADQVQPYGEPADPKYAGGGQYSTAIGKAVSYWGYTLYPSFLQLSAMGAPWAFPPTQKGVGRGSFNQHKAIGSEDPQQGRWFTLYPREWGDVLVTEDNIPGSEIGKIIGQLFLAQGTNKTGFYRYQTAQEPIGDKPKDVPPFWSQPWAIIKLWSVWQLGNTRNPQNWTTPWSVKLDNYDT